MNFLDERLPRRFWDKVSPCPMSGCWLWTGAEAAGGYGTLGGGPRGNRWQAKAHRHAYETRAVNMARSPLTPHARKFATHCKCGHEMTPENTGGGIRQRYCRACERIRYATTYKHRRSA